MRHLAFTRAPFWLICLLIACHLCIAAALYVLLPLFPIPLGTPKHCVISFFVGLGTSALIIISSYYTLQKHLQKALRDSEQGHIDSIKQHPEQHDQVPQNQATHEKPKQTPISKFILGVRLSFGIYRLGAYIVLCACVVGLIHYGAFNVIGYVIGVLACVSSIAILKAVHLRTS